MSDADAAGLLDWPKILPTNTAAPVARAACKGFKHTYRGRGPESESETRCPPALTPPAPALAVVVGGTGQHKPVAEPGGPLPVAIAGNGAHKTQRADECPAPKPAHHNNGHDLPPHDEAAESGILGAMLCDGEAARVAVEMVKASDFYVPKHRALFGVMAGMVAAGQALDEITVTGAAEQAKLLEACGGRDEVGRHILRASPASVETYCQQVLHASRQRALQAAGLRLADGVRRKDDPADLARRVREELAAVEQGTTEALPKRAILKPSELLAYDVSHDPNALLGRRWLCRSGSCLWLGQTGIGKSSLIVQAAVDWALGYGFFGIIPIAPLKSLIVQGENDDGDLAEQFQGIVKGRGLDSREADLQERMSLVRETCRTGAGFARFLRDLVFRERPDLVWLDPLNCYLGGDVSSQEVCSKFFRNLLNPIALQSGAAIMIVHHTNKPPRDQKQASTWRGSDFAYFGSGSSEMANWARATVSVHEVEEGLFELRLAKRGTRAGMLDGDGPDAKPTTVINLEYSRDSICWRRATTSTAAQAEIGDGAEDVIAAMPEGEFLNERQLRALVVKTIKCCRTTIYKPGSKAQSVLRAVQARTRLAQQPGFFQRPAAEGGGL